MAGQVVRYVAVRPTYVRYAEVLGAVLGQTTSRVAPLAIIQARAKTIPSFAEKAIRKRATRPDPVSMFTDLCGARVICRTPAEARAVSAEIVQAFDIDWENSVDASERLRPTEFGYRSVHHIVALRSDVNYGTPVPDDIVGLKAEIQVRTLAEHAFSDFYHDLTYKGAFALPNRLVREIASAAAGLEGVDRAFDRIEAALAVYASRFGRYLDEDAAASELAILAAVLEHDPGDANLALRLARLAMSIGRWETARDALEPFVPASPGASFPAARDLGTAQCQLHRDNPTGDEYRRGQRHLEIAVDGGDDDAIAVLAQTWLGIDDVRALELFRRAYEHDPSAPEPLARYLELALPADPGLLMALGPTLRSAIDRCEAQIAVQVNLPGAAFDQGFLRLLLGEHYEALDSYALGISHCTAEHQILDRVEVLERLEPTLGGSRGFAWARKLVVLGLAARFPAPANMARLRAWATPQLEPLKAPVVVVAGATGEGADDLVASYGPMVAFAFADFTGTMISGGTTSGVCGLVGAIGQAAPDQIRTVGFAPRAWPPPAVLDTRYTEIRATESVDFGPAEPLQAWIDIVAAGIDCRNVHLLGISGGRIAASEYRVALALGASVGIIADSGREAGRLLADPRWASSRLLRLPADPETLRVFVAPVASPLEEPMRSTLGRLIHDRARHERHPRPDIDPSLADWEHLRGDFRESSLQQADHIGEKLLRIGCVATLGAAPGDPVVFTQAEIETMAELEHGRWIAERLRAGWTRGEQRDPEGRVHPDLVAWRDLPDEMRELDREAVRGIPDLLGSVGLWVRRLAGVTRPTNERP